MRWYSINHDSHKGKEIKRDGLNGKMIHVKPLICKSLTGDDDELMKSLTNRCTASVWQTEVETVKDRTEKERWREVKMRKLMSEMTGRSDDERQNENEAEKERKGEKERSKRERKNKDQRGRRKGRRRDKTQGMGKLMRDMKGREKRVRKGRRWSKRDG